jgi:hypothetical protein
MLNTDDIARAKMRAEHNLLRRSGVTGVDVGCKYVEGKQTDEIVIRVHVATKKKRLPRRQMIPATIDGFKTDVLERRYVLHVGPAVIVPDRGRYDPLVGGISIGPCRDIGGRVFSGTLGIVVTDNTTGNPVALSSFHVLCVDDSSSDGVDTMVQPGQREGGICPDDVSGVLLRSRLEGEVDCAIASITGRTSSKRTIQGIGNVQGSGEALVHEVVRMRGFGSGLNVGKVEGFSGSFTMDYGGGIGKVTLTNQITVANDPAQTGNFGADGDSGSVVIDSNNFVVGLYAGGSDDGVVGIANPIKSVLTALDVTI